MLIRLLARMPLRPLHAVGALLGCVGYAIAPSYRGCLRANLERALPGAPLRLRLAAAAQTGRGALEALSILLRPPQKTAPMVREVVGWDHVRKARAAGRGALLVSPHLGCVEILGPFIQGLPLTALYRPHKSARLQALMESGRGRYAQMAPADRGGVRAVVCGLKRGEIALVLPDQVPAAGEGLWAPFFGRPAYTMTLAARLTEMPGVEPFMFCGERLPRGAGYRLHFVSPDPPLTGSTGERVAAINRNIEKLVLRHPDQYLWGYNRYKEPPGPRTCSADE
ncbi:MAG TPA: lysophospholipid acyltransferase family protein [Thermoanaerobaculia bacterium]|nr:lysophospholipid acyltransferase family protein [Thermoanaerobaculia bacterium]